VLGRARLPIASLAVGVHSITAVYTGDTSYDAALTSAALVQTIT
jgi:hypothetical protein